MDTTKTLLTSAFHFFSGTLFSRLTGVVRDMTMAYAFGAHANVAAFFVAYRLAHLFRRILGEGAMQTALVPKFEEFRSKSPSRACRFFADLYGVIILLLTIIILCSIIGFKTLIAYGSFSEGNIEIANLTSLMMPSLLFICLFGLNSAILQCEKNYFIPGVAPVVFNLVWICGILAIAMTQVTHPMYWLGITVIMASFSQWLITVPNTIKVLNKNGFEKPLQGFSLFSKDLQSLTKPFFLGVIGIAAAQFNSALDGIFARYAESEGPAWLWYAIRIQQVPIGLFAVGFSSALLPPLSRAIKEEDWNKFHDFLRFGIKKCLWITLPCTLLIFIFGKLGIQWVYGRGEFDQQSIEGTARCLYAYTLGIVPMALVLVVAPAFYSRNQYGVTTVSSVVSMGINVGLNALFIFGLGFGAVSVALATSASAWVNLMILAFHLKELRKGTEDKGKGTQATQGT